MKFAVLQYCNIPLSKSYYDVPPLRGFSEDAQSFVSVLSQLIIGVNRVCVDPCTSSPFGGPFKRLDLEVLLATSCLQAWCIRVASAFFPLADC